MHIDHRPSLCVCLGVYLLRIYIRSLLRPFARGRLHARFALVLDLLALVLCASLGSWLVFCFMILPGHSSLSCIRGEILSHSKCWHC